MVGDGVFLFMKDVVFFVNVFKGKLVNFVGVGDFVVVGFFVGILKQLFLEDVFWLGVVFGSVMVFFEEFGIEEFVQQFFFEV